MRFLKGVCAMFAESALALLLVSGCASAPLEYAPPPRQALPTLQGSYHRVQRGETLWRIARSYGLAVNHLAGANRLPPGSPLKIGQQLFIPLPAESARFLWPVRGLIRSSGAFHGVDIAAPTGDLVRASRSGRVAVATRQLSGWGKTAILDHLDGYLTVYAGLDQILVNPGASLRQGMPVGTAGSNAVHFEIRYGPTLKNTLELLPDE